MEHFFDELDGAFFGVHGQYPITHPGRDYLDVISMDEEEFMLFIAEQDFPGLVANFHRADNVRAGLFHSSPPPGRHHGLDYEPLHPPLASSCS